MQQLHGSEAKHKRKYAIQNNSGSNDAGRSNHFSQTVEEIDQGQGHEDIATGQKEQIHRI